MNELKKYFQNNNKHLIHKWDHYFDIYDRYFSKYRNQEIILVEFGVFHGGSLQMWKSYFGSNVKIYGVDINPDCLKLREDQIDILIADQDDQRSLHEIAKKIPKIDILIDDGGHTMQQQINTFQVFYDKVASDGIYLCEDLHTSYWASHFGGYKHKNSFIEFSKDLIDQMHAWHSKEPRKFKITDLTKSIYGLHYYDSVLVIEKKRISPPFDSKTGHESTKQYMLSLKKRVKLKLKRLFFSWFQ